MARLRTAFASGTITDNPLAIGATTINSAQFSTLPVVASPNIMVLVLDPRGVGGAPEVVYITAHTAANTACTISRGQEGSSARQHALGVAWVQGPTTYEFDNFFGSDIASAATITLPNSDHEKVFGITGTTTISAISARPAGSRVTFRIEGGPLSIIHSSGLILPSTEDLLLFQNEIVEFLNIDGTNWALVNRSNIAQGWQPIARWFGEATTTSSSPIDLIALNTPSVNIPTSYFLRLSGQYRKSAAADSLALGLKINSTVVVEATSATHIARGLNTNEAQNGAFVLTIGPRATNYLRGLVSYYHCTGASSGTTGVDPVLCSADIPNATITNVAVRGCNFLGSMTVGVSNLLLEVLNGGS